VDRFQILARLAVGGMAEVFVARAEGRDSPVVLKRARGNDRRADAMLRAEAGLTLPLHHANLVRALELVEISGRPCLVLELVEGESLARLQRERSGRALSPGMASFLVSEIASGLAHVHQARPTPLVHGDVNASNVLISRTGQVKLGDFGIAEARGTVRGTHDLRGQAGHLPPEALRHGPADPRGDLFLLGLLLAELLRGESVIAGASPDEMLTALAAFHPRQLHRPPVVPEELWKVVVALLQPDPARRTGQAHEVIEALQPFAAPVRRDNVIALFRRIFPEWRSPAEPVPGQDSEPADPVSPTTRGMPAFNPGPEFAPTPREPVAAVNPVRISDPTPRLRLESPTPPMQAARAVAPTTPPDRTALDPQTLQKGLTSMLDAAAPALPPLTPADLIGFPLPRELLTRVPRAWAERLTVVPLAAGPGALVVACPDADPSGALSTLRSVTGCSQVRHVKAAAESIRQAIERGYEAAGLKREPLLSG
jgi:serine/threonine protein kinase